MFLDNFEARNCRGTWEWWKCEKKWSSIEKRHINAIIYNAEHKNRQGNRRRKHARRKRIISTMQLNINQAISRRTHSRILIKCPYSLFYHIHCKSQGWLEDLSAPVIIPRYTNMKMKQPAAIIFISSLF